MGVRCGSEGQRDMRVQQGVRLVNCACGVRAGGSD